MKAGWCRYEHASLTAPILPAADINVLSQYVSAGLTDEGGNRNLPPDLQGYTTLNQCHAVPITGSCAPNVPRGDGDVATQRPLSLWRAVLAAIDAAPQPAEGAGCTAHDDQC